MAPGWSPVAKEYSANLRFKVAVFYRLTSRCAIINSEMEARSGHAGLMPKAAAGCNGDQGMRNHREEIELALAGGAPEVVPFTFYDHIFPPGFDPAQLQAKGMAICARRMVYRKYTPNVKVTRIEEGEGRIRTVYETPVGMVSALHRIAALALTPVEHPIKTRDDYRAANFIVQDACYEPDYDHFLAEIVRLPKPAMSRCLTLKSTGWAKSASVMKWRTTMTPSWNFMRRWPRITRKCMTWSPRVRPITSCMAETLCRRFLAPTACATLSLRAGMPLPTASTSRARSWETTLTLTIC
jgi:hypothetical protein